MPSGRTSTVFHNDMVILEAAIKCCFQDKKERKDSQKEDGNEKVYNGISRYWGDGFLD